MSTLFLCLLASSRRRVPRTEDASGAAGGGFHAPGAPENASRTTGGCPQSVESAVLRASENAFGAAGAVLRPSEDASRTREGCFAHRISLPYRKRLFFTPNASEDASRTIGACFLHRVSLPYRRSLFLVRRASENASHLVVRSTGKRVAVASERPVHPRTGEGKGSAGDKFRVSGGRRKRWKGPERTKRAESPQRQAVAAAELRTSQSRRVRDFHPIGYVRSGRTKKEADL